MFLDIVMTRYFTKMLSIKIVFFKVSLSKIYIFAVILLVSHIWPHSIHFSLLWPTQSENIQLKFLEFWKFKNTQTHVPESGHATVEDFIETVEFKRFLKITLSNIFSFLKWFLSLNAIKRNLICCFWV